MSYTRSHHTTLRTATSCCQRVAKSREPPVALPGERDETRRDERPSWAPAPHRSVLHVSYTWHAKLIGVAQSGGGSLLFTALRRGSEALHLAQDEPGLAEHRNRRARGRGTLRLGPACPPQRSSAHRTCRHVEYTPACLLFICFRCQQERFYRRQTDASIHFFLCQGRLTDTSRTRLPNVKGSRRCSKTRGGANSPCHVECLPSRSL